MLDNLMLVLPGYTMICHASVILCDHVCDGVCVCAVANVSWCFHVLPKICARMNLRYARIFLVRPA